MDLRQVAAVRRFNRLVTQRAGALEQNFLGRDRPLGESRVLFEVGEGADLRDLRARLSLDSGYLSRMIRSLEEKDLVATEPGAEDERVRRVRPTRAGRREVREMNRRSDEAAAAMLERLAPDMRERLVQSMDEVYRLLRLAAASIERIDPASPVARSCVARYFTELESRFEGGFDHARSITTEDDDFRPPAGAFLAAMADGEPLACGAVMRTEPRVGSIKRMWVAADARGHGFGRRMLRALEEQARELGISTVRLETNRSLTEAIGLYRSAGYVEVDPFNTEPYANHWFEKSLS